MPSLPVQKQLIPTQLSDGGSAGVHGMLSRLVEFRADCPILSEMGPDGIIHSCTCAELYEEVMCLGEGLLAAGLGKAHLAVVSRNSSRYVKLALAVLCGENVLIPIDALAPQPLLETLLSRCDADAVLCDQPSLPAVLEARRHCPNIRKVITLEGEGADLSYDAIVESGGAVASDGVFRTLRPESATMAFILFSSGTTGTNKGVMLSRTNIIEEILVSFAGTEQVVGQRSLCLIPMHHAACLCYTLSTLMAGMHNFFGGDVRSTLSCLGQFRPERIMAVPMMVESYYKQLCAAARRAGEEKPTPGMVRDLLGGSLRLIVSGGAGLNPETIRGMNALGIRVFNIYGATECSPIISINRDTVTDNRTVGRPVPGLEVRLDDPDETGVGTLCLRGKKIAMGYYKDPEATRAVFGADGFFNTGDSVRLTEDGRIVHLGRKVNTLVLSSGENIYPQEIEQRIVSEIDCVTEAVVYLATLHIGKASREVLCAGLYIPEASQRADRAAVGEAMRKVNGELPPGTQIEYVELPDTPYPRTASMKLRRTDLPRDCSGDGILLT